MSEDDDRRTQDEVSYGLGRVLALSDAVFAIAMTLLVLGVPLPKVPAEASPAQAISALGGVSASLTGFGLSFVLIGLLWIEHRQLFARIRRAEDRSAFMNLVLLLLVCLVPFSTSFYTRTDAGVVGAVAYYGTLLFAYAALLALDVQAISRDPRTATHRRSSWRRRSHTIATMAGFAGAMGVSVLDVQLGPWAWVLVIVANVLVGYLNRSLFRSRATGEGDA